MHPLSPSIPFTCLLAVGVTAAPAIAETYLLRADLREAVVYDGQAELTRSVTANLPAGRHRLLIAIPDADTAALPDIAPVDGLEIGPIGIARDARFAPGALDTPAQAAARAQVEAAETVLQDIRDEMGLARITVEAAELQMTHLRALADFAGDSAPSPDDLSARLASLGEALTEAARTRQIAERGLREMETRAQEATRALADARAALADLSPYAPGMTLLSADVTARADISAELTLTTLSQGVYWSPSYEISLDSETGAMAMGRFITLEVDLPEVWEDVDVTFSTEQVTRALSPSLPNPTPARIAPPAPPPLARSEMAEEDARTSFLVEPEPVIEAMPAARLQVDGLSVSYAYQTPVSVGAAGMALLPFDTLVFEADLTRVAVPRLNTTAFLMAEFENDGAAPILPGPAVLIRDGAVIGETFLPLIAAGAEQDMPFGALDHLRLSWRDLSLDEGDRGVFVQSSTQTRALRFTVENTGPETETVEVLYALPFAEQEDLDVEIDLSRAADETAWDDRRGVHMWAMTLPPGTEERVDITLDFDWPEGQVLNWWP